MPYNVLIVDDDREYRESFKDRFTDFNIIEASSGQDAIQILKKPHEIDVVVLDEKMPGMSGTQVLEEIKKVEPNIQAVILTSKGSEETAIKALRNKAEDYLQKIQPFEIIERRIRQLAEKVKKPEKLLKGGIEDKIEQMKYFAQRNYHKNIRLDDLAERLFLSQKYLSKIFKQYTGMTYNEYKIRIKIEKAKELLKNKDYNIYKIAEHMGYQNTESFIRIFERETGYTPTTYRGAVRAKKNQGQDIPGQEGNAFLKPQGQLPEAGFIYSRPKTRIGRQNLPTDGSDFNEKIDLLGHELRSPLGTMRIITHNIRKRYDAPGIDKEIGKIETMITEADRIIDNVLLYGKTPEVRLKETKLQEVLNDAFTVLDGCVKNRGIRIICKNPKKDVLLQTDPLLLRQVLLNILQNACQSVPENKGKIEVETSAKKGGSVSIVIKDNGPGINKKDLERVFMPFFTTKSKGAGLGLTVCNKIMPLLKGSLALNSSKKSGVKVMLQLPANYTKASKKISS